MYLLLSDLLIIANIFIELQALGDVEILIRATILSLEVVEELKSGCQLCQYVLLLLRCVPVVVSSEFSIRGLQFVDGSRLMPLA